jgi:Zn-dependent M28 family amino/carboxypeptidase
MYDLITGGQNVTVNFSTFGTLQDRFLPQVIAETKGGDKNNVLVVGAHLDSRPEGPGINDDGSGTAMLLAQAEAMAKNKHAKNLRQKIRFGWWGAEEEGLIGSTDYVDGLKKSEAKKILLYLNFDMLGSPNFARLIYDGDGSAFGTAGPKGSDAIEHNYEKYFKTQDLPTGETAFDGRSDYLEFITAGIPAGGLFSGAEEIKTKQEQKLYGGKANKPLDPCYHLKCDDINTISKKSLDPMADAVADSLMTYAFNPKALNGGKSSKASHAKAARAGAAKYVGDKLAR